MTLYNAKAVAQWLDLTDRRVRQLRDEGVIKEARPGLYDLGDTIRRYINYIREKNPDSEEALDYYTERAKLARAKRMNEEYDLQLKQGVLHRTEDIEAVMTDTLVNFKTRLLAIPAKLAPTLAKKTDKADVYRLLKEAVDEALLELSDFQTTFKGKEDADDEAGNG